VPESSPATWARLKARVTRLPRLMENGVVKRLIWSGLLAGLDVLSGVLTRRLAALAWRRVFDEEPPE
jgi:hypothetical protein